MPPVQTVTNLDLIQTLEALDKFQQKIYDRASAYTRIIIGLAYAEPADQSSGTAWESRSALTAWACGLSGK